ncbi:hypothetical protein SBP1_gp112 [Vibrio virus vB_VspP_SBP1]|uniref:Uncharacterized protein n=1 Tax=Vibrio virus vB_VspP_SBP1 TaxID=2500581 RepID=A0A3T0IIW5_9CAUD|nr:hypothetical protein KNU36_gp017 [Vibrio virus vB_VspP_SBP1]AZU99704.1 hypothetical protein SBP1_gp112 [Vibrio virus vB_VspP_SBP1]
MSKWRLPCPQTLTNANTLLRSKRESEELQQKVLQHQKYTNILRRRLLDICITVNAPPQKEENIRYPTTRFQIYVLGVSPDLIGTKYSKHGLIPISTPNLNHPVTVLKTINPTRWTTFPLLLGLSMTQEKERLNAQNTPPKEVYKLCIQKLEKAKYLSQSEKECVISTLLQEISHGR